MRKVFILLRAQTGHDFSQYKPNTINRRVERRMAVQQIERLGEYVRHLQQAPAEVEALFRDLLIGVTKFFRDADAFTALEEQVVPRLFAGKDATAAVRVWVPGCSSGEEAYSIAILLQEEMERMKRSFKVQVFATDIDRQALEQARAGLYPAGIAADISPQRLARYFAAEENGTAYRVRKELRDMLVFSEHDLIKDPPFSRLDLVSCRNLLIYMGGDLQKKVLPLFHYALKPGGALFLGTSETVGEFTELFAALDLKSKLYRAKEGASATHDRAARKYLPSLAPGGPAARRSPKAPGESPPRLRELTERALLQQFAPAGALIDQRGDILYLHGRTGLYLEPAPGEAGMNILKMAREGLRRELTTAVLKAVASKGPVRHPRVRVKTNGDFTSVDVTVRPLAAEAGAEPSLLLVVFEESPPAPPEKAGAANTLSDGSATDEVDARIAALKQELRAKEEYLETTNEELATSNEELKSSNEEMQSVNEELQSTNEELETSKEELQSLNEEMATVNAELQQKVADLSRVNNDMNNLMAGTDIGTVFVDFELRIQRFTPAITQLINLISSDLGRPVGHIVSNLVGYDRLVEDVKAVLDTLVPKEIEVQTKAGAWHLLRIRPYRTLENVIEGAVVTFTDITETKNIQAALQESMRRLATVVRDARDAIVMQDLEGLILAWNPAAERMYGWSEAEALTMNILDLVPKERQRKSLAIVKQLARAEALKPYRFQRTAKGGRIVEVWLSATALTNETGEVYAIVTTERQIRAQR